MNRNFVLLICSILCFFSSCKSQGNKNDKHSYIQDETDSSRIDIDSLYINLSKNTRINYEEIPGQFVYVESDEKSGKYLARFIGEGKESINYISYSDDRKDTVIWENSVVEIKSKLDPASVRIYYLGSDTKQYVVFIGKGQSASGSGMQMTFFILSELNEKKKIVAIYEFESRFGSINNLLDFKKDGVLDYFKVSNGKKQGEYLLTVHNIANDQQVGNGYILLAYKLNDRFIILDNQLE
jgi:hypothetical protein